MQVQLRTLVWILSAVKGNSILCPMRCHSLFAIALVHNNKPLNIYLLFNSQFKKGLSNWFEDVFWQFLNPVS